jgi:microcystin-dependent protein
MANTILLPFMLLEIPIVGVEVGPAWAAEINQAFTRIDEHDHTTGKGALIPSAALNINADLSFSGNDAISLRSTRYVNNGATLSGGGDLSCISVVNGNLYFNNASGVPVQITSGSGLNFASLGTIGGDYGQPLVQAAATYSDTLKTFSWSQAPSTPAKMYMGDIILQAPINGAQAVTIKADPTVSSYDLTLPLALPASKKILTMDGAGQVAADYDVDNVTIEVASLNLRIKDDGVTTPKILNQNVTTAKIADGNVTPAKIDSMWGLAPVGAVIAFAAVTAPSGWLTCDGSAVSRTTYANLYSIIGDAHGNGDGSSTFNLPDYRGRFLRGVDGSANRDPDHTSRTAMNSGGNTGNAVGTVQSDMYASHNHIERSQTLDGSGSQFVMASNNNQGVVANNNTANSTAFSGGNETRPINAYVNYIIRY